MNQKIALYGGSFDPPHLGHLLVISQALKTLALDKLIVVPAYQNPFKSETHASSELRLQWLHTLFKESEKVEVSDFEIKKNRAVSSYETVKYFKNMYETVYFIIGADNLHSLRSWSNFQELDKMVTWVVASRGDVTIPSEFLKIDVNHTISSSLVREKPSLFEHPSEISAEIIDFYTNTTKKRDT